MDDDVYVGGWFLTAIAGILGAFAFDWEGWNPYFGGLLFGLTTLIPLAVFMAYAGRNASADKPDGDEDELE